MNIEATYDHEKIKARHLFPKLGRWFFSTSAFRITPSLFIIGVQKGGTTSLAQYLLQHPQVVMPQRKDVYFFNNPENFAKGISWYKAHFALRLWQRRHEKQKQVTSSITIDATPNYFSAPSAALRLKSFFPEAKLILLLRNPAERAWSNYRMSFYHGFEKLSFEDALAIEDERLKEEEKKIAAGQHSDVMQRLSYRTHGIYHQYLVHWFENFRRDQLLILRSEDLFEQPSSVFRDVTRFAGLDDGEHISFDVFNKGKMEKEMNPSTRDELMRFYEPHNRKLFEMIGRDMNWN